MSVDALSDSELRSKLMEYGYPVGPVTQTTRKILVKKLKNLIESRGGAGSRHSLAARYSSEDTDDDTSTTKTKKKKALNSRRQTMGNPMPPPPSVVVSSDISVSKSSGKDKVTHPEFKDPVAPSNDHGSIPFVNRTVKKITQKKYTKIHESSSMTDGLETGSDSDVVEEIIKTYPQTKYLPTIGMSHESKVHDRNIVDHDQILKSYETKSRSIKDNKFNDSLFSANISPIQPVKDDVCIIDNTNQKDLLANYETPFLSEFTRRLSSRASINSPSTSLPNTKGLPTRHVSSTVPELKEKDSNGHFSSLRSLYSSSSPRHSSSSDRPRDTMNRTFKPSTTGREDARNNQNMVSVILVVVLAMFFGVLAVIYMGLGGKTETLPSLSTDSNIPQCFHGADLKAPGVNCILKENVDSVLQLLKRLQPILARKSVSAICDNSSEIPYLTDSDIMQMFTKNKVSSLEVKEDLQNAQLLVIKNPQWGISLIDVSDDNEQVPEVLDSLDKLFSTRLNGKVGMIIANPELPMQCHIKNKLFTVFSSLLIVSLGLLAAIGMQKLFVWYIRYKKNTERAVFKLVSEIINVVEMHHQNAGVAATPGGTQESFLAINHVRDNLIPPKSRKKLAGLWEQAVKFLDENESRIRREVQQVAGEEFHVWRWLPNNSLNKSNAHTSILNKKSKVWQGQAFETMEGSVNSLACSPTPCLKIRHMFDPDVEFEDDWETKVQDAILEKCGESVKILHIRVDRGSREGCVYMKCLSQEDAGKAYRALHGCWFDGHLVTVKYLRLERYHERFPDAICCTTPLKPSNNQRLSMQAHHWQSLLEAN